VAGGAGWSGPINVPNAKSRQVSPGNSPAAVPVFARPLAMNQWKWSIGLVARKKQFRLTGRFARYQQKHVFLDTLKAIDWFY
jgi:hypothetical protein